MPRMWRFEGGEESLVVAAQEMRNGGSGCSAGMAAAAAEVALAHAVKLLAALL